MDEERRDRLRELFDAAMDLDAPERAAFIARSCQGDDQLRLTLESLIGHSLETGSSFEQALAEAVDLEASIPTGLNLLGRTLGHYRITGKIGKGGMGEVYRAADTRLGRNVAIKILPEEFGDDSERLARFEREAQALALLNHPNVATIHGIEEEGEIRFLVLELVDGETLGSKLAEGPLPTKNVLRLAVQIAEGLAKAHQAGVVHRDLKPDNLMLTTDGFVKILDFGLAKTAAATADGGSVMPTEPVVNTDVGRVMGTTSYMSPEQARGEVVDHRSDQFAFGSVFFEMITGRRAFGGSTSADALVAIMRHDPEYPEDFDNQVPQALRWILERCLAKEPADRYESTHDLARDLRGLSERLSGSDRSTSMAAQAPTGKRWALALGGVLLGAVLIAAAVVWWQPKNGTGEQANAQVEPRAPDRLAASEVSASIAVLPLENLGPTDEEYFADGMTDALIIHLSKIEALKVISRTSVMQYKGSRKPLPEIARELGVETVLTGSVLHAGDRVRISTQLTAAAADHNLWAESYERNLSDILALQGEVARAIAGAVKVEIDPEVASRMTSLRTIDREAHEAYLRGLAELEGASSRGASRLRDTLKTSIAHFERAIEIEPAWAEPLSGLARSEFWLASIGGPEVQRELYPRAKAVALRAIELDDTVAEAYVTLGNVQLNHDWDWVAAERSFERAFELDPNNSNWGFGRFLVVAGRFDEAIAYHKRAQERFPTSPFPSRDLGRAYLHTGRTEEAEAVARRTIAAHPESSIGHDLLASVFVATSRFEEATAVLEEMPDEWVADRPWLAERLPVVLAKAGRHEEARQRLHQLEASDLDWFPGLYWVLGEEEKAMAQIEAAFAVRRDIVLSLRFSADCRSNPRCREILETIGFPNLE